MDLWNRAAPIIENLNYDDRVTRDSAQEYDVEIFPIEFEKLCYFFEFYDPYGVSFRYSIRKAEKIPYISVDKLADLSDELFYMMLAYNSLLNDIDAIATLSNPGVGIV